MTSYEQRKERAPPASWEGILRRAITTPRLIHEAYSRFHHYSLRNQMLAMCQCLDRGLAPGPLATFKQWESLGRHVMRGQKALVLCVPIAVARPVEPNVATDSIAEQEPGPSRTFFAYRSRWFVLAQTDGEPYEPVALRSWSKERALASLDVRRIAFEHHDGNAQGYSTGNREVAISPVAALPHKTLFHELAHVLLSHHKDQTVGRAIREVEAEGVALLCCEALRLDGAEYARGYLQHWLKGDDLTATMAQRIITTAHRILQAGRTTPAAGNETTTDALRTGSFEEDM